MEVIFNIESEEDFLHVIQEILDNLYDKHKPIKLLNETSIATVKNEMKDIFFKTGCLADKVYELLISKGFNKARSKILSTDIENRKSELLLSTLLHYNSELGETITDFDWSVKVVYGTSELKKLKYPLLQLAFTTLIKGHQQQRIYDINKDMLDRMISVLENIETQS